MRTISLYAAVGRSALHGAAAKGHAENCSVWPADPQVWTKTLQRSLRNLLKAAGVV